MNQYSQDPKPDPGALARLRFQRLLHQSNRNTEVLSLSSPPLATSFVKSSHESRAHANKDGSLAEIIYPSTSEVDERIESRLGRQHQFAYASTAAAFAFPAGYGERSAQALKREESTYQLRGVFATAALAFVKLKARVEARGGNVEAIDALFAALWGLSTEAVSSLPQLHIAGTEMTRIAATEDRAYHSLSGHPAYSGGFRVDLATITPDAIGARVPLNWPRLRTSLKAIASVQLSGDIEWSSVFHEVAAATGIRVPMDLTKGSQVEYMRPTAWENLIPAILASDAGLTIVDPDALTDEVLEPGSTIVNRISTLGTQPLILTCMDALQPEVTEIPNRLVKSRILKVAGYAKERATIDIQNTIRVIEAYDRERAMLHDKLGEKFEDLDAADLSKSFEVPRYKVTRKALFGGFTHEDLGRDDMPDMRSHGPARRVLNMSEFRYAELTTPIDVQGALNMAVYIMVNKRSSAMACYQLLSLVKDPNPNAGGSVGPRIRNPIYFQDERIRKLGSELFGESYMGIFDSIVANMTIKGTAHATDIGLREAIWSYLSGRGCRPRKCPVRGGWRDLISFLWEEVEGWTLYFWVRISMGKLHFAMSNSILAPIAAGDEVDFLTLMRKGIKVRADMWSKKYAAEALLITDEEKRRKEKAEKKAEDPIERYVPPNQRRRAHLECQYGEEHLYDRKTGLGTGVYQRLVELQAKSKFFALLEISTLDRRIAVGISDENLRQMFIEFYQARWYSLEKRINKCKEEGTTFLLGFVPLHEHPWGELITEYPESVDELLMMFLELEEIGWTIAPDYLLGKLRKSIAELWEDIIRELNLIRIHIEDVHTCLADEQTRVDAQRRVESVVRSMSGIDAIPVPTIGYRAMHKLPERATTIPTARGSKRLQHSHQAFVSPVVIECGSSRNQVKEVCELSDEEVTHAHGNGPDELGALGGDDASLEAQYGGLTEMDEELMSFGQSAQITEIAEYNVKHLTYRAIWATLDLPSVSDEMMKVAYAMPCTTSLDSEHLDAALGPVIPVADSSSTRRLWHSRLAAMKRRMGHVTHVVNEDDMM